MAEGSLRGSVFNLISTGVGAGILSLPVVLRNSGLVLGTALLAFGCLMTLFSLRTLMFCGKATASFSYSHMCERAGGRGLRYVFELMLNIYALGTLVAYFLIIYSYMPLVIDVFNITGFFANSTRNLILFVSLLVFPLCCLKSIGHLRYTSLLSVIAIFYVVICIIYRCFGEYFPSSHAASAAAPPPSPPAVQESPASSDSLSSPDIYLFRFNASFFTSLSIVVFAYNFTTNVFSVYSELYNPSPRRISKVLTATTLLEFLLYFLVSLFSYLQFGSLTQSNILLNYSAHDVLLAIGRIAIICTLLLHCPLQTFPAFQIISQTFDIHSEWARIVVTALFIFSALSMSIYVPELSIVFSLLGATCAISICYLIPGYCYLQLTKSDEGKWQMRLLVTLFMSFTFIIGLVASSHIIGEIIRGDQKLQA